MYFLISLAMHTSMGSYSTLASCNAAIRSIYEQKLDPYHMMPKDQVKAALDSQMIYLAPKEYICTKQ